MTRFLAVFALFVMVAGCGPKKIPGTGIEDKPEHREVLDLVERYRQAMEARDARALLALASPNYYEDAGTPATDDDYGHDGLKQVLDKRFAAVEALRLDIKVKTLTVKNNRGRVDYRYSGRFQLAGAKTKVWHRKIEDNRIEIERLNGRWLIQSGM